MATGFQAWKATGVVCRSRTFAYTPLVNGTALEICQIGFFALFGIYATNAMIARYVEGPDGNLVLARLDHWSWAIVLASQFTI